MKVYDLLDLRKDRDLSLWTSFLIAFYLMLRKSNVVPPSIKGFDRTRHLSRQNFVIKDNVVFVKIQWSKTNQFGKRHLVLPLLPIDGHPLCPVAPLKRLLRRTSNNKVECIFKYKERGFWKCWTQGTWVKALRSLLSLLGYKGDKWSGHSFRRGGGATFAFACGLPGELIQLQGDWKSDTYKSYLDCSLQQKAKVAKTMKKMYQET